MHLDEYLLTSLMKMRVGILLEIDLCKRNQTNCCYGLDTVATSRSFASLRGPLPVSTVVLKNMIVVQLPSNLSI